MTASGAYSSVAESAGLKPKDVKAAVEGLLSGGGAVEEERIFQVRRCLEFEAQEEARNGCPQGCEPIHEGAMCVQSQACQQDGAGVAHEEVQGDGELRWMSVAMFRSS